MDGSKRKIIVSEEISQPTGLAIDYHMYHTIYWVDTKLNRIEMMSEDGSRRRLVAKNAQLRHPVALDVFESMLYWVTRDSGEILHQDKFGRGVPAKLPGAFVNPSSIKVFAPGRYNTSLVSRCAKNNQCSHLCLLTPKGSVCACPDTKSVKTTATIVCDAPKLPPKDGPR